MMIKVDLSKAKLTESMDSYKEQVAQIHDMIHNKTGQGSDFLGWVDLPVNYDKDEVEAMKARLEFFIDKDQMIEYVNSVIKNLLDDHSSVTNRHYKCLACGRPKVIPTPVDNTGASPISSSRDSHNTSELPSLKFTIPRI